MGKWMTPIEVTSRVNQAGEHIDGLVPADFRISKGKKTADASSAEDNASVFPGSTLAGSLRSFERSRALLDHHRR